MAHLTAIHVEFPVRAIVAGSLLSIALLGALPLTASAVFERDVRSAAVDAVCGAGPAQELTDLLTATEPATQWRLRATSAELYGLSELRGAAVSVSRVSRGSRLSAGWESLGGAVLREQTIEVAGTRRWSQGVCVGLRCRALCLGWEGGTSEWAGAVDLAAAWLVGGRLVIGLSARNITRSLVLSSPVSSGVSGEAALVLDGVTVLASLSGEPGFAPSPAVGCDLALASWVRVRAGIRTEPSSTAFGLCLGGGRTTWPELDLAWCWHPVLGSSYSLTVSIHI